MNFWESLSIFSAVFNSLDNTKFSVQPLIIIEAFDFFAYFVYEISVISYKIHIVHWKFSNDKKKTERIIETHELVREEFKKSQ